MYAESSLLASDLDGTLIPPAGAADDGAIPEFAAAVETRADLLLAYVTGRHRNLAMDGIDRHELPPPHVVVCDVGTSVYVWSDGDYLPDPHYRARMAAALGGADRDALRASLEPVGELRLQEPERQAEFKLSYYTPSGPAGNEVAERVRALLDTVASANVVFSVDPDTGEGLLDVLPAGVAKDTAVRYLHDRFSVPEDRLVYAGDSGNDRAAMLSGYRVVVVANADEALKAAVRAEARSAGLGDRLYFARGSYARGVVEGCRHFGIL